MDFEIAVVAVGLARKQRLNLPLGELAAQRLQGRLGFLDDGILALGLAELDEFDRLVEVAAELRDGADLLIEPVALTQELLRLLLVVPEIGRFREGVQLLEAFRCDIPVKDASSAGLWPA